MRARGRPPAKWSGKRARFKPQANEQTKRADQELISTSSTSTASVTAIMRAPLPSEAKSLMIRAPASARAHFMMAPHRPLAVLLISITLTLSMAAGAPRATREPAGSELASLRVAALASKLEQWLVCHRLSLVPAGANQTMNGPAGQIGCSAHFDGHLCWPASRAGEFQRLACPRLAFVAAPNASAPGAQDEFGGANSKLMAGPLPAPPDYETIAPGHQAIVAGGQLQPGSGFAFAHCEPRPQANLMLARPDYSECSRLAGPSDPTDKWVNLDSEQDKRLFRRLTEELERIEGPIDPYSDPDLLEQWTLCIGNIMHEHEQPQSDVDSGACPIIFDGWRCWPSTRAGETAYVSCPKNQPGFSAERNAHKICTQNGTWYRHPQTNRYWSNYTTCVDTVDLAFRTKILNLYVIGNLISLVALAASLIVFISFKSLKCTRVTIHKNLFLSFITNNFMWIIWYTYVVSDANLLQSNPIECQFWHILLHYFLVSNYFWMFCEGLYLHTILVVAFVSEDKILKWFYLLGWLTPVPITVAYAYNRFQDDYYTNFCWMDESPYNLILMVPIGLSLLLNLIFLINIVRVLVTKLRANNSPDTHQTRKAVRATLILIPLLGLHYILTPFRPEAKSEWEVIYESIAAVCTSFQGLCVALLFCFCNGEVIYVLKKRLKDTFNRGQPLHHHKHGHSDRIRRSC